MFQTKRKLVEAEAQLVVLWKGMLDSKNDLRDAYSAASVLSETNSAQALTLLAQQQEIASLRKKCEELAAHIQRMNEVPTQFASGPLWMSEEEEDARYQHETGGLNGEMLREKLLELGLDPEITHEA